MTLLNPYTYMHVHGQWPEGFPEDISSRQDWAFIREETERLLDLERMMSPVIESQLQQETHYRLNTPLADDDHEDPEYFHYRFPESSVCGSAKAESSACLSRAEFRLKRNGDFALNYISGISMIKIIYAMHFAASIGAPLNNELTICYQNYGLKDDIEIKSCHELFIDRYRAFMKYNNLRCEYVYVWERGRDIGLHVHMAFHLENKKIRNSNTFSIFRKWLYQTFEDHAVRRKKPRSGNKPYVQLRSNFDYTRAREWARYLLKGLNPRQSIPTKHGSLPLYVAMGVKPVESGRVPFRRIGISNSLGETRQRALRIPSLFQGIDRSKFAYWLWESQEEGSFLRAKTPDYLKNQSSKPNGEKGSYPNRRGLVSRP